MTALGDNDTALVDFAIPGFKDKHRRTHITLTDYTFAKYTKLSVIPIIVALRLYFSNNTRKQTFLNKTSTKLLEDYIESYQKLDGDIMNKQQYILEHLWRFMFYIFIEEYHEDIFESSPFLRLVAASISISSEKDREKKAIPKLASPSAIRARLSGILFVVPCLCALRKYKYTKGNFQPKSYEDLLNIMKPRTDAAFGFLVDLRALCVKECNSQRKGELFKPCLEEEHGMCGYTNGIHMSASEIGTFVKKLHVKISELIFQTLLNGHLPSTFASTVFRKYTGKF